MKIKKGCGILLLATTLFLSGCGGEALYELTEAEQQLIVNYSAHVVSKFNRYQKDGLTYVLSEKEELSSKPVIVESETEEERSDTLEVGNQSTEIMEEVGEKATLDYLYEASGLCVSYTGYEIANTYVENQSYALKPTPGKTFAILKLSVTNTGDTTILLDQLSEKSTYSLKGALDGEKAFHVPAIMSLLSNDFATYEGSLEAGSTEDMVLIFEIPKETVQIENLILKINKNGTIFEINL